MKSYEHSRIIRGTIKVLAILALTSCSTSTSQESNATTTTQKPTTNETPATPVTPESALSDETIDALVNQFDCDAKAKYDTFTGCMVPIECSTAPDGEQSDMMGISVLRGSKHSFVDLDIGKTSTIIASVNETGTLKLESYEFSGGANGQVTTSYEETTEIPSDQLTDANRDSVVAQAGEMRLQASSWDVNDQHGAFVRVSCDRPTAA